MQICCALSEELYPMKMQEDANELKSLGIFGL